MHLYVVFGLPWYVPDCFKMMCWISRRLHNMLELWNKLTFVLSHMALRLDLLLLLLLQLKICLLILSLLLLLLKTCSLIPLILVWSALPLLLMTGVTIVAGNVTLRMIAVIVLPAIRCQNCGKLSHFAKVCRSTKSTPSHSTLAVAHVKDGDRSPPPITKIVELKGKRLTTLIDTGNSQNLISARIVKSMNLSTLKQDSVISMASSTISLKLPEYSTENITFNGYKYKGIFFMVLPNYCTYIILGVPFLEMRRSITISFGGSQDILKICA